MNNNDQNISTEQAPATPPPPTPPAAPAPAAPSGAASAPARLDIRQSPGAKAIAITTAIVGGIALLGAGGSAAFAATGDIFHSAEEHTVDVTGVDILDLDVAVQNVAVRFEDVPEAELSVTNGQIGDWTVERDGETLIVHSPRPILGRWFTGFDNWGDWGDDGESVVLTLPESLQASGLNAKIELVGGLDMSGTFGELTAIVAGSLSVDGAATSLDLTLNAGAADVDLDGAEEARFDVSAGRLTAALTGTAPRDVILDLSAGSAELTVPDVAYNLDQNVSAGTVDSSIEESSTSRHTIDVSVAAGTVTLRPGD